MTATEGDAWRSIYGERDIMARQPPLSAVQLGRWQQQALTETFSSYLPEEIFDGFHFPCVNGHCEWSSAYPRREVTPPRKVNLLGKAAQHNRDLLLSMHSGKDDRVSLEESMVDVDKGFEIQQIAQLRFSTGGVNCPGTSEGTSHDAPLHAFS